MEKRVVKDIKLSKETSSLVEEMLESGGFTAKKVGIGVDLLEKMNRDDCIKFLSFPSAIISTGTRGVIKEMVKNKLVDVLITTCGTWDHDLSRTYGEYYHGDFLGDDIELHKQKIHREGNIYIPQEFHGEALEENVNPVLEALYEKGRKELSTREISFELGKSLDNEEKKEGSILYWAYKNEIPVYIPAPTDGTVGSILWLFNEKYKDFKVNLFADEHELNTIVMDANKTGALMIGGGVSKHHTIWWNQFRGGLDYAVFITTADEWDGSLSGARMREAISWGKLKEDAEYITIEGDATTLLPLMISALKERLNK